MTPWKSKLCLAEASSKGRDVISKDGRSDEVNAPLSIGLARPATAQPRKETSRSIHSMTHLARPTQAAIYAQALDMAEQRRVELLLLPLLLELNASSSNRLVQSEADKTHLRTPLPPLPCLSP
jgi:hypothetical protein